MPRNLAADEINDVFGDVGGEMDLIEIALADEDASPKQAGFIESGTGLGCLLGGLELDVDRDFGSFREASNGPCRPLANDDHDAEADEGGKSPPVALFPFDLSNGRFHGVLTQTKVPRSPYR